MAVSGKLLAQRTRRRRRDCMPRCTRTGRSSRRPRAAAGTTGVPCAIGVLTFVSPFAPNTAVGCVHPGIAKLDLAKLDY